MTSQYRHRRTSISSASFPNPIEPGEITVNTANRQIAVGDAASASVGAPKNLLAIRIFDTSAQYAIGDLVTNNANLYRAKVAIVPGPFVLAQWDDVGGLATINDNPPQGVPGRFWWESDTGILWVYYDDGNSTQWVQIGSGSTTDPSKVSIAGDTMQNYLIIHGTVPTLYLDKAGSGSGQFSAVKGGNNLKDRWQVALGNTVAETGGNAGSNFEISRMNDAGGYIDSPLQVFRSSGIVDFLQKPTVGGQIFAAPFDALAYNGMQINGSMDVSQELGAAGFAPTATPRYVVDGWMAAMQQSGSAGWATAQTTNGPTGIKNCIYIGTNGATTFGAGDYVSFNHFIEGYRVARLNFGTASAQPVTIGFWTTSSALTGTMCVSVRNAGNNRSYVTNVTLNTPAVWEYKTITIPGDTAGTWNTDNTRGLNLTFSFASGTTFQTAANVWTAGNFTATPQLSNFWSVANTVYIAGVVVLPGIEAPSAARSPFIMRPYDQELVTCKRYWQARGGNLEYAGTGTANSSTSAEITTQYEIELRSAPTITLSAPGDWGLLDGTHLATCTGFNAVAISTRNAGLNFIATGWGSTSGFGAYIRGLNSNARIKFDARL